MGRRRRRRDEQFLSLALFLSVLVIILYFAFKYGVDDIFFLGITAGFVVAFLWRPVYCRVIPGLRRLAMTRRYFIAKAFLSIFMYIFGICLAPPMIFFPLILVLPFRSAQLATLVVVAEFLLRGAMGLEETASRAWRTEKGAKKEMKGRSPLLFW